MDARTSQLQIRVTEHEKATLKRLASASGLSVSRYVLTRALPSGGQELTRLVGAVGTVRGQARPALEELARFLSGLPPGRFTEALEEPRLDQLNPVLRNQVAAMVEQAAQVRSVEPPGWVGTIAPPSRPHFGWPLSSLRAHQLRVTPVPFKRRNVFFDPASPRGVPAVHAPSAEATSGPSPQPVQRLTLLAEALRDLELKVEFYLLGGALVAQAFRGRPATAHVSALFAPEARIWETANALAASEGWPGDWLPEAVKGVLPGGGMTYRYLELPSLSVYVPPLQYVLALKVGALRLEEERGALEDIRYVLRALNVTDPEVALTTATRYLGERAIVPDAPRILRQLLAG